MMGSLSGQMLRVVILAAALRGEAADAQAEAIAPLVRVLVEAWTQEVGSDAATAQFDGERAGVAWQAAGGWVQQLSEASGGRPSKWPVLAREPPLPKWGEGTKGTKAPEDTSRAGFGAFSSKCPEASSNGQASAGSVEWFE